MATNPFMDSLQEFDSLDAPTTEEAPTVRLGRMRDEAAGAAEPQFVERCSKCGGSGTFRGYGKCYACKGRGEFRFVTSPEQRAKARDQRVVRQERTVQAWAEANPTEMAWIIRKAPNFGFAASMADAVRKYGSLTDNQMGAVRRCMAQETAREHARVADELARAARAIAVNIAPILTAFATAQENGVRFPKLRLDTFRFNLSAKGPIYVKEGALYLGKITAGAFTTSRECTPDQQARILAVCADPKAAAIAYGQRFSSCCICGRELSNKESVDLGIGPICAGRFGWG